MESRLVLELVGYLGSVLIAVSLMMSSLLRLRIINMAGALVFTTYGFLIGAYPVAALNGFIVIVNAFYLAKMFRAKEFFQLLPLRPDSDYLRYFLDFYNKDIQQSAPGFEFRAKENLLTLFILRNCSPTGVFIAEQKPDGELRVMLDYVIPPYRDFKNGRFLFVEQAEFFRSRVIKKVVISPRTKQLEEYLVKVGFQSTGGPSATFCLRYDEK